MPTPRQHGGAALQHIPLATPGFKGLNTEQASGVLGPEWATDLQNAVIDGSNRLSNRKGWADQTTTPNADALLSGFEYEQHDGTVELIYATDNSTVVRSTDGGVSFSDVTGTATFTSGQWHWINFADRAIGLQDGKAPIFYTGTSFAHIVDVNAPKGGAGTSFGGRLWISDNDGHTMKYCALLDDTDWTSADSGFFSFENVWKGTDTIQAIASTNGRLVVFGKRNIIIIADDTGSMLGIDPTQAYVVDVIEGVGCIAQQSVQNVGGDLWFLSDMGLTSLGRVIQEKSNPLANLSQNVRTSLMEDVADITLSELRSVYSPLDRFYLLSLPKGSGSNEVGKVWVFDTRGTMEGGAARCLGTWTGLVPTTLIRRTDDTIFASNRAYEGELFQYNNYLDNGADYTLSYRSGWTDLGAPGMKKIFKRFSGVFFSDQQADVAFKWAWDFEETFSTRVKQFTGTDQGGIWDLGLWGTAVWGGGRSLREGKVVPAGTGEYIKWGIDADISSTQFSIQQLELFAKIGRLG
jgi:hypothetical protein